MKLEITNFAFSSLLIKNNLHVSWKISLVFEVGLKIKPSTRFFLFVCFFNTSLPKLTQKVKIYNPTIFSTNSFFAQT